MRFHLSPEIAEYTPDAIENRWSAGRAKVEVTEDNGPIYDEIIDRNPGETDTEFRRRCARRGLALVMAGGAG